MRETIHSVQPDVYHLSQFHSSLSGRFVAAQDLIDLLGQYPDIATATLDKKL
jgi:hypothetical protein